MSEAEIQGHLSRMEEALQKMVEILERLAENDQIIVEILKRSALKGQ